MKSNTTSNALENAQPSGAIPAPTKSPIFSNQFLTQSMANSQQQQFQQSQQIAQTQQVQQQPQQQYPSDTRQFQAALNQQQLQQQQQQQQLQQQQYQQQQQQLQQSQLQQLQPFGRSSQQVKGEQELREDEFEAIMNGKQNEAEATQNKVYFLQQQYDSLANQYQTKQQEILKSNIQPLQIQVDEKNKELKLLQTQLELERSHLADDKTRLNNLTANIHELEGQIHDLEFQFQQSQAQLTSSIMGSPQLMQNSMLDQNESVKRAYNNNNLSSDLRKHHRSIFNGENHIISPAKRPEEEDVLIAQTEMIERQQGQINFQDQLINEKELVIQNLREQIDGIKFRNNQPPVKSSNFCC